MECGHAGDESTVRGARSDRLPAGALRAAGARAGENPAAHPQVSARALELHRALPRETH